MDGKRDWRMTALPALCVIILLIVNLRQGRRLSELEQDIRNAQDGIMERVGRIDSRLSSLYSELESADDLVRDWDYTTAVDVEKRCLLVNVSMELKEWREDTEAELAGPGGTVPLKGDGAGTFTGVLEVPAAELSDGIDLDVLIQNDGARRRERLNSWEEISLLLPLRARGGGWSGPVYRNGEAKSNFDINLENTSHTKIAGPRFCVYLNGEPAQEVAAEVSEDVFSSSGDTVTYAPALPDQTWSMACETGDQVEITFSCQDGFGLGYEFPFMAWTIGAETPDNHAGSGASSGSNVPALTWPE